MLKELEKKLREEHAAWTEDNLWNAFATVAPGKVKGRSQAGRFADLVALVRFALEQQPVLEPFAESVTTRFNEWLMDKAKAASQLSTINSQPAAPVLPRATRLAQPHPRPHRHQPEHRAGRFGTVPFQPARRPGQSASALRRQTHAAPGRAKHRPRRMNRPHFTPNPVEFDGFRTGIGCGRTTRGRYYASSIPAKPLVQAKLKRGGFLVGANTVTP